MRNFHNTKQVDTMADDYDFDIPELNRIDSILDDLIPVSKTNTQVSRISKKSETSGPVSIVQKSRRGNKKKARFKRFSAHTLSQLCESSNWKNTANFRSKLIGAGAGAHSRMGAVKFSTFGESVNWKNAHDGPQLVLSSGPASPDSGPPETVDGFFETMIWE
jgi:hypothetical protein